MIDPTFIIIACPDCEAKNRVKRYDPDKILVCAKCRTPLVGEEEHDALSKFGKNLGSFADLPDIGLRSDPDNK